MKFVIGSLCLLALLLVGILFVQGKEGRIYKVMTKLLKPIQMVPRGSASTNYLSADYAKNFTEILADEGWQWQQEELVDWALNEGSLEIKTTQESVWWQNSKGPMLFRPVKGDVEVSVIVKARKASAPDAFPDKVYQFGGIILRDPASDGVLTSENYIFNVIGHRGSNGIQVETKSTQNGWSSVDATNWNTGDVALKIKREGVLFSLFAKSLNMDEWQLVQEYRREDLPEILQFGVIVYSYSRGKNIYDLNVSFSELDIRF